jgi:hypothetical protein
VYRERQFLRLCRHTRIMGSRHLRRGAVGENQQWQKEIAVHWDCFEKLQNYCSIGELQQNSTHLEEDPVSTKTEGRELHKPNIHGRAAIAKPLITESNAEMRKRWCHDHKTRASGNRKRAHDIRWVFPHAVTYGEHSRKPTIRNAWFQQWNTGGGSVMIWAAVSWYSILLVPLLPFTAKLLQVSTWCWVISCIPWSRRYFQTMIQKLALAWLTSGGRSVGRYSSLADYKPRSLVFFLDTVFQDDSATFTQPELFSRGLKSMKVN